MRKLEGCIVPREYRQRETKWIKRRSSNVNILGRKFTEKLEALGWEKITHTKTNRDKRLEENLRQKLERLNEYEFSVLDWAYFFNSKLKVNEINHIEKRDLIQREHVQVLKDSTPILLLNKTEWAKNSFQFLQHSFNNSELTLTLLINGFPLVYVEIIPPRTNLERALKDIKIFQNNNYRLYEYIHLFVISNGEDTRYFVNSLESKDFPSLEKTNNWTDRKHNYIKNLEDFSEYFLKPKILWDIITKYCTPREKNLIVMRPYQISATETILQQVEKARERELWGSELAGGYIWHATGSGKTLTCFKASQLVLDSGEFKVLFLVDRTALNKQTEKFFRECSGAEGKVLIVNPKSTKELKKILGSIKRRIVITTVQKLRELVRNREDGESIEEKCVLFFDECHRSLSWDGNRLENGRLEREYEDGIQGESSKNFRESESTESKHFLEDIKSFFKNHCIFGFTGTPIFKTERRGMGIIATEDILGKELHRYTLDDAFRDGNVLQITVYVKSIPQGCKGKKRKEPRWVVEDIISNFESWTRSNNEEKGFGAIFAVNARKNEKIIEYYWQFKKLMLESKSNHKELRMGIFISEPETRKRVMRKELMKIMSEFSADYESKRWKGENFRRYKEEVLRRLKEGELDLIIVANMLLTGFDEAKLNTLILNKNKKIERSLEIIQAFSRTNRIYDSEKVEGRVVWYGDIEEIVGKIQKAKKIYHGERAIELLNNSEEAKERLKSFVTEVIERLSTLKQELESLEEFREGGENFEQKREEFCSIFKELKSRWNKLLVLAELKGDEDVISLVKEKERAWSELRESHEKMFRERAGEDELYLIRDEENKFSSLPPLNLFDSKLEEKIAELLREQTS